MKKFAAIAVFIFSFIFVFAQLPNGGSKEHSAITPVPKVYAEKMNTVFISTSADTAQPELIDVKLEVKSSTACVSIYGDTMRINQLKAKVIAGTATPKEMRELRDLQAGNQNLPEKSKSRFGIGLYPIQQEVSLREHFGKSGFGNRICLEEKFGLQYEKFEFSNIKLSWRDIQFDTRLLFSWRNKPSCRLYSGIGLAFTGIYTAVDDFELYGYREIIPIGMELFPSERLPNLGIIGETAFRELSGLHINAGLVYYLR